MKEFQIHGNSGLPITFDIHLSSSQKSPIVIFLHGFKGFKDWGQWPLLSQKMSEQGVSFLKMNFSHNGTTPSTPIDFSDLDAFGNNTVSKETQDVKDVIDWLLINQNEFPAVDMNQLFVMAHSRGGAIALITANENENVKGVITLSGVGDLVRFGEEELAYWKKTGVVHIANARTNQQMPMRFSLAADYLANEHRFAPQKVVKVLHKRYLIIHAEKDETVVLAEAKKLHDLGNNTDLKILEGANHSFGGTHPYKKNELPLDTQKAMNLALEFIKEK